MIRVLIVDDSPTLRELIRRIIESDPELTVAGEAHNGLEAIRLCQTLDPDIITMDIEMPKIDGYQAIRTIMAESPRPIVVLTSSQSDIRLGITFKGIEAGALMVVRKPRGLAGESPEARELVQQIKAMAGVKVVGRRQWLNGRAPVEKTKWAIQTLPKTRIKLIAIGASTGGPPALRSILGNLPADFPIPVVAVQHISRGFVKGLARWLDETAPLTVKIAFKGENLRRGVVYFAPDDHHMQITASGHVLLTRFPKMDGHRPSVTVLFNSVAKSHGHSAVGTLLTGMGRDGADGLKTLHTAGGYTLAQDEKSCIVFGMPKEAIKLGAAKEVLSLERIGPRIRELVINNEQLRRKK